MKFLKKFDTLDDFYSDIDIAYPAVLLINNELKYCKEYEPAPDSDNPLYVHALESLTVSFSLNNISYSLDKETWTELPAGSATPLVPAGSKVYFKASGLTATSSGGIGTFTISGKCYVGGNVMSMLHGDDFVGQTTLSQDYAFYKLFENAKTIYSASRLSLPSTNVTKYGYAYMFNQCQNLIYAPALPATQIANYSYYYTFYYCKSLVYVPALHATTLGTNCCTFMFYHCESLVTAPALPATTLAKNCYNYTFAYCYSLVNAPELPAKTLQQSCYSYMFQHCRSLEIAPVLPAVTLTGSVYNNMFQNCSKLKYIKAMFTSTPSFSYMSEWVSGVATEGTFVKNSAATWSNTFSTSSIPSGWSVETASA